MGGTQSTVAPARKTIEQLDPKNDALSLYFRTVEDALASGSIDRKRAMELFRARTDAHPEENVIVVQACQDPANVASYPNLCRALNEIGETSEFRSVADDSSRIVYTSLPADDQGDQSEFDITKFKGTKPQALKFMIAIEKALQEKKISQAQGKSAMERYSEKYPRQREYVWADCDSQDLEEFPELCKIVAACEGDFCVNPEDCVERSQGAKTKLDSLVAQEEQVKRELEAAKAKVDALDAERKKTQLALARAEKDCEKRIDRTAKERAASEKRAAEAKKKCKKEADRITAMQNKVDKERQALQDALEALRKAQEEAGQDCDEAMKETLKARQLEQKEKDLQAEYNQMMGIVEEEEVSAPEPEPVQLAQLEQMEPNELDQANAARAITLPSHNPYFSFDKKDDPDDYQAPGGRIQSLGGKASILERDAYEMHPFSNALNGRATCEHFLALYHDLMSQSPWSKDFDGNESKKYALMRKFEGMYMSGKAKEMMEKSTPELAKEFASQVYGVYDDISTVAERLGDAENCRSAPFDFVPWGTSQLFRNWPANRPIRKRRIGKVAAKCEPKIPNEAWLRSKISTQNVPFDVRWYDVDLYFAHAALLRLFRMQVGKFVEQYADGGANARLLESYARQLPGCTMSEKQPADWQQCIVDHLASVFRPEPNDNKSDADAVHALQRELFADGGYLSTIQNKKRKIAYFATLALIEDAAKNNGVPSSLISDRVSFLRHIIKYVEMVSGVYRMVSAFPETTVVSREQQKDRDHFINEIGVTMLKHGKPFERVAYEDYRDRLEQDPSNATRKLFLAAEALRWHLFWLSGHEECTLRIPLACLLAAVTKLHQSLPPSWYVIDAQILRNFAIINYSALTACGNPDSLELSIDNTELSGKWSGDLLDASIASGVYDGPSCRLPERFQSKKQKIVYESLPADSKKQKIVYESLPADSKKQKIVYESLPADELSVESAVSAGLTKNEHRARLVKEQKLAACSEELCRQDIQDRKSYLKWLKKGHPDKGGDNETFMKVLDCLNVDGAEYERTYCADLSGSEPEKELLAMTQPTAKPTAKPVVTSSLAIRRSEYLANLETLMILGDVESAKNLARDIYNTQKEDFRVQKCTDAERKEYPNICEFLDALHEEKKLKAAVAKLPTEKVMAAELRQPVSAPARPAAAMKERTEKVILKAVDETPELDERALLVWRRMRQLENLKTIRGEREDSSAASNDEKIELKNLSAQFPFLEKALPYVSEYAELRRLKRQSEKTMLAGDLEFEQGELTPQEALEDLEDRIQALGKTRDGRLIVALLNAEYDLLGSCYSIKGATKEKCDSAGCGFSAGSVYNACYDTELNKEDRGLFSTTLPEIKVKQTAAYLKRKADREKQRKAQQQAEEAERKANAPGFLESFSG